PQRSSYPPRRPRSSTPLPYTTLFRSKPLISEVLADMEPPMRTGMAKAYARKFSGAQLTDLNTFLATPTGQLYAGEWMALQADPRSEEHTSELQSREKLVCRLLLEKKK